MERIMRLVLALLLAVSAYGQSSTARNPNYGANKVAGGNTLPASCTDGQLYFLQTGTKGLYQCVNRAWSQVGSGSGGGGTTSGAYASLPAAGTAGALYMPTDSPLWYRDTGSAWSAFLPGYGSVTPPAVADFAWINQASGSVTASAENTYGYLHMSTGAASGENWRLLLQAIPSPTPKSATMTFMASTVAESYSSAGICVAEDGDTPKFHGIVVASGANITSYLMNSPTAYAGPGGSWMPGMSMAGPIMTMRVTDTGTNLVVALSSDRVHFHTIMTVSRTVFLAGGPTRWGPCINAGNASNQVDMSVLSWSVN